MRRWWLACAVMMVGAGLSPGSASAAISSVLSGQTVSGQAIPCTAQADGTRVCQGDFSSSGGPDTRLKRFDDTPLEVYVILPPAPSSPPRRALPADRPKPRLGQLGRRSEQQRNSSAPPLMPVGAAWIRGAAAHRARVSRLLRQRRISRFLDGATGCKNGYIRLDDERYEARDVQYTIGLLVDGGDRRSGTLSASPASPTAAACHSKMAT